MDILEAKLATAEAFNRIITTKINKTPTAATAQAEISKLMGYDNMDEKKAGLIELAQDLNVISANGEDYLSCYYFATALTSA